MTDSTRNSAAWRRHRAARLVANNARDARDLAELLDMLGLSAGEGLVPPDDGPGPAPPRHAPKLAEECAGRLGSLLRTSLPRHVPLTRSEPAGAGEPAQDQRHRAS